MEGSTRTRCQSDYRFDKVGGFCRERGKSKMTNEERVRVTVDDHGVAEVAMVRVDKLNAIDAAMFKGLIGAIDQLRSDKRVRVVVLHGEGRAFCAGLDMSRFQEMGSGQTGGSLGDILARTHGLAN